MAKGKKTGSLPRVKKTSPIVAATADLYISKDGKPPTPIVPEAPATVTASPKSPIDPPSAPPMPAGDMFELFFAAEAARLMAAEKAKKGRGRPTKYTLELGTLICAMVADKVPVAVICARSDMPSKDTLYRWKRVHPEFSDLYARARAIRCEARQDHIDEIIALMKGGQIEHQVGKAMIDAEKWQMSKEAPHQYGDKIQVDVPEGGPLHAAFKVTAGYLVGLGKAPPA